MNRQNRLPEDFVPEDLRVVDIPFMTLTDYERAMMRDEAATAIEMMFADAESEGIYLLGISGYRSYDSQQQVYAAGSNTGDTERYIAEPGASEHQTGLAMDVGCSSAKPLSEEFAYTREGGWLAQNAHKYGFVMRYPQGGEEITGYGWEPWHIRYVGSAAEEIYKSGLALEEYLQSIL